MNFFQLFYRHLLAAMTVCLLLPASSALAATLDMARLGTVANYSGKLIDGKPYSLAEQRGKVVVVIFWATWCPYCKADMPRLQKLYETYRKRGLTVLAISIDDSAREVRAYLKGKHFTFPVAWRHTPGTRDNFIPFIRGTPTFYLLDKKGRMVRKSIGSTPMEELVGWIEPLL